VCRGTPVGNHCIRRMKFDLIDFSPSRALFLHFYLLIFLILFLYLSLSHTQTHTNTFSLFPISFSSECVTDLDYWGEMIIFESILTTSKSSIIFRGSWGSIVNWLEPKIEPPSRNLACPNLCNALYVLAQFLHLSLASLPVLRPKIGSIHRVQKHTQNRPSLLRLFSFWGFNC